ncbi:MAG: hydrogenase 4 subunit F [Thermomicrobiales bacterium]
MLLFGMLAAPLITALLCWCAPRLRWRETINVLGATVTLVLAVAVLVRVNAGGPLQDALGLFYADALSAYMAAIIAAIGFAAALYSVNYLRGDLAIGHVPGGEQGLRWYYLGFHVFIWTMLTTVTVSSLGLLWVGAEATTLASALLVGFYRTKAALEAAWKYLILCTVGITIALFGVLLTYLAADQGGVSTLTWHELMAVSNRLDPAILRLAFVFVLVGFGTKAGFAPMHTWLADAHSQAPSPVSAVLSGVLLSCALYAILRFHALTSAATGDDFSGRFLLAFGVLSLAVAVPFLIVQRDLKRLLAYSSVEHIGLLAVAFGIGGPIGTYAGLLHLFNHAVTKSLLFFIAGDLVQRLGTRRLSAIRGAIHTVPLLGWALLLGLLAISGVPLSGIFVSEFGIVLAGFAGSSLQSAAGAAVIALLALAFAGLLGQALRVGFGVGGKPPVPVTVAISPDWKWLPLVASVPLALLVFLLGVRVPEPAAALLHQVAAVLLPVTGGGR